MREGNTLKVEDEVVVLTGEVGGLVCVGCVGGDGVVGGEGMVGGAGVVIGGRELCEVVVAGVSDIAVVVGDGVGVDGTS